MDDLLFFASPPTIELCTNRFINVPVVLKYDDTALISVTQAERAGFTTEFAIYSPDGIYIAKVKGSRLFVTQDGRKANLSLRHPPNMTVCELDGQTLFEVHRKEPAALSTYAELYTPDGSFVKCGDNPRPDLIKPGGDHVQVGRMIMSGNLVSDCGVGIWVRSDGSVAIGCV